MLLEFTMSTQKFVTIATLAGLAVALAVPIPRNEADPSFVRKVDLAQAINNTVCPISVELDVNLDRVPQRIKMMKCAEKPKDWCKSKLHKSQHLSKEVSEHLSHDCCQRRHGSHELQCVELYDTVLVYYKNSQKTTTHQVPVGCTCMIVESTTAHSVPDAPS